MQTWMPQVKKGMVEFWVMASLGNCESYGYELMKQLTEKSGEGLSQSTIYPILARLMREGWVKTRVGGSPEGPPRHYYGLTPLGETRLKQMTDYWKRLQRTSDKVLHGVKGQ